jgi:hypothetical protein
VTTGSQNLFVINPVPTNWRPIKKIQNEVERIGRISINYANPPQNYSFSLSVIQMAITLVKKEIRTNNLSKRVVSWCNLDTNSDSSDQ